MRQLRRHLSSGSVSEGKGKVRTSRFEQRATYVDPMLAQCADEDGSCGD